MRTKNRSDRTTIHSTLNRPSAPLFHLPQTNGYELSTEQLHQLLSDKQHNDNTTAFDKAVQRQQMTFVICNTLDRQNLIHEEIRLLNNHASGAAWLDQQIVKFNQHCPAELKQALVELEKTGELPGFQYMCRQNYSTLLNEIIITPLKNLSEAYQVGLNAAELEYWYQWCQNIQQLLNNIKQQVLNGQQFFTAYNYERVSCLLNSAANHHQFANLADLFYDSVVPEQE